MATAAAVTPSEPGKKCATPCSSCSGARCWRLALLTIVSLVVAQIFLYYNGSSMYDVHRWSVVSSARLRLRWFSNYSAPEDPQQSHIDSLSLGGEGKTEGNNTSLPAAGIVQTTDGGGGNNKTHNNNNHLCPPDPPNLKGRLQITKNPPSLEDQQRAHPELTPGGHYHPENCTARHKVAIIIPYRNRENHLVAFVHHMHPFLQRQQLEYNIYVVEQAGNDLFNRGMLMNVGVREALKQYDFDCLVLHDVDLLPEDDRNLYTCSKSPRHMSVALSSYQYKLPYETNFGGVSAMTAEHYIAINGFSNEFWGWGGEDDDLFNRVRHHGLKLSRYPSEVGRYTVLSHKKEKPSPDRFTKLRQGKRRFKTDGLNSIKYQILKTERRRLFTLLSVALARK